MTTTIIRDELGNRKPMVRVSLPGDAVDPDGSPLAGVPVYVPATVQLAADGTVISGGSGGGGGAATIAAGADTTQGTKADVAWDGAASAPTVMAVLKALWGKLGSVILGAGEAHIGAVGGDVAKAAIAFGPASSTTYTTGQVLLAPTEITNAGRISGGSGLVTSVGLALAAANTAQVDAIFFSSQPSGTYTAGTTFTAATADLAKLSKVYHVSDWTALGATASHGQAPAEPRFYRCDDNTKTRSLWVMLVARGSITLASATDGALSVRLARN